MGVRHLLMVGEDIKLTDVQREKLETMMTDFQMESIDLKAKIEKAQLMFQTLKQREDAVEADVMRSIDDAARLEAEMQKLRYRHHQQARSVLTDEQVKQLQQLRQERFQERRESRDKPSWGSGR